MVEKFEGQNENKESEIYNILNESKKLSNKLEKETITNNIIKNTLEKTNFPLQIKFLGSDLSKYIINGNVGSFKNKDLEILIYNLIQHPNFTYKYGYNNKQNLNRSELQEAISNSVSFPENPMRKFIYLIKHKNDILSVHKGLKYENNNYSHLKHLIVGKDLDTREKEYSSLKRFFSGTSLEKYNRYTKIPGSNRENRLSSSKGTTEFKNANVIIGGRFKQEDHEETYYSQKVLKGKELNIPGRHIAKDKTIRDKDGFIAIAAHYNIYPKGSIIMTSLGPGKVYDTGTLTKGKHHIDLYTDR